jgi:phosphohistidine phosphatase SixA
VKTILTFLTRSAIFALFIFPLVLVQGQAQTQSQAETKAQPSPSVQNLIQALQGGGHIIYMRHGATRRDQKDQMENTLESCDNQRNLSDQGRAESLMTGEKLKALNIPIGSISSSPFCRCTQTAELTFGEYTINPNLQFSMSKDAEESRQLGETLFKLMLEAPTEGPNTVFVGHTSNLRDGLGVWPKPEGVIVVFKREQDKIQPLGMIKPSDWESLQEL